MQVHYDIEKLPVFTRAVITIGTFDGVHMGHRQVIARLREEAAAVDGETVIITFHPHPRKVVSSAILGIRLINTLDEKIGLLRELEIDHLVVVPFTPAFANQPAESYLSDFLIGKFHPHTIIIGYDHRFGRERLGDYRLLENKSGTYHYRLEEIPKHVLDNISISSTRIREAILHSQLDTANHLLGYNYFFSGEVVHGDKLGRKLGYPTANLRPLDEEKLIPGDGIYAVYAELDGSGKQMKGMMSIGFRPTVDGKKRVSEVNLFDFDQEIYGHILKVTLKKYLRAEIRFNNLDELVHQMDQDKLDSLDVL
ncbi:MAG: riboflavin biosynthesis protein RibF [Chitinophagaceae bacterium]